MYIKTLTVSALNNYIKKLIDSDFILGNTFVKGELSNFKIHNSGHAYFSIKDETSKINCVMFRSNVEKLSFIPEDGMKVILKGKVSVYQRDGSYQLYCEEIKLEGMGELYFAFQKLKEKLEKEGLFDKTHKKKIPLYPSKIGVITSATGAAIRDIINVTKRRNPLVDIVIYPALVQGVNASQDIINGLKVLNSRDDIDIIILARGGGSIEELWCFNDEKLAYEVYNSNKPIITGVGHEIDYTIVDFVGDLRAPTPSAAAEIAVPDINEIYSTIQNSKAILNNSITQKLSEEFRRIEVLTKSIELNSPENYIINQYRNVDMLKNLLGERIDKKVDSQKEVLSKYLSLLNAHNPLNILNRGYSILQDKEGAVISSISRLKDNSKIRVILKDGTVNVGISCIQNLEDKKNA